MKYGVIDIGSNSVRLLVSNDLVRDYKKINTTGLGRGLALTGLLKQENMIITANAVKEFYQEAKLAGCDKIFVFATEAVRSAKNRQEFVTILADMGIEIDIVASQNEAKLGFYGAYTQGSVCVMDIGGASTELAVGDASHLKYAKSMPIGLVRMYDNCGEDLQKLNAYIDEVIKGYGKLPHYDEVLSIGGTASTFVAMAEEMQVYDYKVVDNYKLRKDVVAQLTQKIHNMTIEQRLNVFGLEPKRREVIVGGGILLNKLMTMLGKDYVIVRESDNQEGYLKYKMGIINFD